MRVLLDHPNPFLLAHGGLQIQIEQTKNALEGLGVEVDFLHWWDSRQTTDLIHFFGRPHPAYIQQAKKKNIPVIFSDLLGGLSSRPPILRFIQKGIICMAQLTMPKEFTIRMGWASYQTAARVIALTPWEKHLMLELFGAHPDKVAVVPNGVERLFFQRGARKKRKNHLIATMTITEVKRPIELVRAAVLAKTKIRIFGLPYQRDGAYFRRFLDEVRQARPWVDYLGGIADRRRLAAEYRQAAGFVLLSSWESQSLSALEAAACGCPLLLSDLPWARSSFGDRASYVPLASSEVTAGFLRRFMEGIENAPKAEKVLSWEEVATCLIQVYREAMTCR